MCNNQAIVVQAIKQANQTQLNIYILFHNVTTFQNLKVLTSQVIFKILKFSGDFRQFLLLLLW